MAEVVQDAQQEFWRSPAVLEPPAEAALPAATPDLAEACADCSTEFMIGARFCHTCGRRRPVTGALSPCRDDACWPFAGLWARIAVWASASWSGSVASFWHKISFPNWLHYLHFHEIKR